MGLLDLSEQEILRRESLKALRDMGIEPYPAAEYKVSAYSTDIKEQFKDDAESVHASSEGSRGLAASVQV